jgi:HEAT repeat protein
VQLAEVGFVILNTNAIPAIPDLERLMKDNQKPVVGLRAIYALGAIGGPAITALTNSLANTNQSCRIEIMNALLGAERESPYYYGNAYRGSALPALTRALNDPDPSVCREACVTLYNITNVTPQLLKARRAPAPPR